MAKGPPAAQFRVALLAPKQEANKKLVSKPANIYWAAGVVNMDVREEVGAANELLTLKRIKEGARGSGEAVVGQWWGNRSAGTMYDP